MAPGGGKVRAVLRLQEADQCHLSHAGSSPMWARGRR
jgi:hypothetical protein